MNKPFNTQEAPREAVETRRPFEAPVVRREARMPVVTAGSFDLIIPNP